MGPQRRQARSAPSRLGSYRRRSSPTKNTMGMSVVCAFAATTAGAPYGQAIDFTVRPTIFDHDVPALNEADLVQASSKCVEFCLIGRGMAHVKVANHRHCRLLPVRHHRPCGRAAEERDEVASLQL